MKTILKTKFAAADEIVIIAETLVFLAKLSPVNNVSLNEPKKRPNDKNGITRYASQYSFFCARSITISFPKTEMISTRYMIANPE